jgi:hypothetical protein
MCYICASWDPYFHTCMNLQNTGEYMPKAPAHTDIYNFVWLIHCPLKCSLSITTILQCDTKGIQINKTGIYTSHSILYNVSWLKYLQFFFPLNFFGGNVGAVCMYVLHKYSLESIHMLILLYKKVFRCSQVLRVYTWHVCDEMSPTL